MARDEDVTVRQAEDARVRAQIAAVRAEPAQARALIAQLQQRVAELEQRQTVAAPGFLQANMPQKAAQEPPHGVRLTMGPEEARVASGCRVSLALTVQHTGSVGTR